MTLLLSHAPIDNAESKVDIKKEGIYTQGGGGSEDYKDRADSQKELQKLVEICFEEKAKLNFEDFKRVAESVTSEIFLCLFSIIKTHFPSIQQFKHYEKGLKKKSEEMLKSGGSGKKLAPPKVLSKFSPLSHMVKFSTPKLESKALRITKSNDAESLEETKGIPVQRPYLSKVSTSKKSSFAPSAEKVPDSPIGPAVRLANTKIKTQDVTQSPSTFFSVSTSDAVLYCECGKSIKDFNKLMCEDCISKASEEKVEGYLLKKSKTSKKVYISLGQKEFYSTSDSYSSCSL